MKSLRIKNLSLKSLSLKDKLNRIFHVTPEELEGHLKYSVPIQILGALLNPVWWLLCTRFFLTANDPLEDRLVVTLLSVLFGVLVMRRTFGAAAPYLTLISGILPAIYLGYLTVENSFHALYCGIFILTTTNIVLSSTWRWRVVLSYGLVTAVSVGIYSYGLDGVTASHAQVRMFLTRETFLAAAVLANTIALLATLERVLLIFNLRKKSHMIEKITKNVPNIIRVTEVSSARCIYVNEQFTEVLGYPVSEVNWVHENWLSLVHPEDGVKVQEAVGALKASTPKSPVHAYVRYRFKHRDGHFVYLAVQFAVFSRDQEGEISEIISVAQDVSSQVKMEQDLEDERAKAAFAAQLSSLGEMAGGIAHEINNPLAIISSNSELIEDIASEKAGQKDWDQVKVVSATIIKTVNRIASIVRGLKSLSRDGSKVPVATISVFKIMSDVYEFCKNKFERAGVTLEFTGEDVWIEGREVQMAQVIINLLNNAFDAVHLLESPWVKMTCNIEHGQCTVTVSDSGSGVPPEIRERIFQPFFTTKEVGKGTGLGLSISHSILQAHGGKLTIDPLGGPSTFRIVLPLSNKRQIAA